MKRRNTVEKISVGRVLIVALLLSVALGLVLAGGAVADEEEGDEGTVYIASGDPETFGDDYGEVWAVDASTGDVEWGYEIEDDIHSSPTVADDTVYVGSRENYLLALSADSGDLEWEFEAEQRVDPSPTIVDGKVYFGSRDDTFYAVDAETGNLEWEYDLGDSIKSSATVVDGTVYFGAMPNVHALDAETGERKWEFDEPGFVDSSPTVVGGTVYVGASDGNVYAIDADSGEKEWSLDTDGSIESSPAVVDGTVYIGSDNNDLWAIDAGSGEEEWTFETSSSIRSSPTVADDTVYVGSNDDSVYAVDSDTGDLEWEFETGAAVLSSPTVADDTVYVGSNDGFLYALSTDSGDELWSHDTDYPISLSSPTYVPEGSDESEGTRNELRSLGHNEIEVDPEVEIEIFEDDGDPVIDDQEPIVGGTLVFYEDEDKETVVETIEFENDSSTATVDFDESDLERDTVYPVEGYIGHPDDVRMDIETEIAMEDEYVVYQFEVNDPEIVDVEPAPNSTIPPSSETEVSVTITDPDFPSSEVDVLVFEDIPGAIMPGAAVIEEPDVSGEYNETVIVNGTTDTTLGEGEVITYTSEISDQYISTESDVKQWEVAVVAREPIIDDGSASPSDGELALGEEIEIEIDVEDPDFPDSSVLVEFYEFDTGDPAEDDVIGTDTLQENGTASITWESNREGLNWYVVAEDEYGAASISDVFSFDASGRAATILEGTASPADGDVASADQVDLSVEILNDDFPDDELTVEFYEFESGDPDEDELIGSTILEEEGEASTVWDVDDDVLDWYVWVEDEYNNVAFSRVFSFGVSGEIEIRDAQTEELIDDRTVCLDTNVPGDSFRTNVTDGTYDLEELTEYDDFQIEFLSQDYYPRTAEFQSTVGGATIYLERGPDWVPEPEADDCDQVPDVEDDENKVLVRFDLQDRTDRYPPEETLLNVRGPAGEQSDAQIHSELFGSLNRIDVILDQGERYDLEIENADGDTRNLGRFTASESESISLDVGDLSWPTPRVEPYVLDVRYDEEEEDLVINYVDEAGETRPLEVVVEEIDGDDSIEIYSTTSTRQLGEFTTRVDVEEDRNYLITATATRDGETVRMVERVGTTEFDLRAPFGDVTMAVVSGALIVVVAGMVGGGLSGIGAVLVAAFGGLLAIIGWLPIPWPAVVVALVVALLFYVGDRL